MSCKFQDGWLDLHSWLRQGENIFQAKCSLCKKTFNIKNMGLSAIKSHEKGDKHSKMVREAVLNFTRPPLTLQTETETESSQILTQQTSQSGRSAPATTISVNGHDVLSAEILWVVKCVTSHYSCNSCSDIGDIFKNAFPDSAIAQKFSCGENKISYLVCFTVGPYIQDQLANQIKTLDSFVLMFDESHNYVLQKKQVDIHVRFWDDGQNRVVTLYLKSDFIRHGNAEDVLKVIMNSFTETGFKDSNLLQLSMDGPNVNWKLFRLLNAELEKSHDTNLLNIGSCGLHSVHNAFKNAAVKSEIQVSDFIKSIYDLFHDTPARRDDYMEITGSKLFPLKFCGHRWLENKPVVVRAMEILPNIIKYVEAVKGNKSKEPTCKSYGHVRDGVSDKLLLTKLSFFHVIACQMSDFLQIFQSERPLTPLLCSHIEQLIKQLMKRFLKNSVLKTATNMANLLKIDVLNTENHVLYKDVDIGFKANGELRKLLIEKKISERHVFDCRMKCKSMLVLLIQHMMTKTPITFAFARNLGCFHPKRIVHVLGTTDIVQSEYDEFIDFVSKLNDSEKETFLRYDALKSGPLDVFFIKYFDDYPNLRMLFKKLITISHGQAGVERGFSINKEVLTDNLSEQSSICQCPTEIPG